jgi:succinate-semialdehyde dehydrogenase/glutarate-semialdehyde dehydrogenase
VFSFGIYHLDFSVSIEYTIAEKNMENTSHAAIENPATGETIGVAKENSVEDLARAVRSARDAQPAWAALDVKARARFVRAMRDYIACHVDEVSETISRSTGKTRIDALSTEVLPSAMAANYYAKIAPRVHKSSVIERGNILLFNKVSYLTHVPFGVIGIISPWNYPFSIPFHEVVMALLAGNAVILKVATQVQLVGEELAKVVMASGLPAGLFHLIHMPGPVAGTAMLDAGVNKLFFTGGTVVGKELMAKAAHTLTPVVLELGGNDAMIVLDDANPDRAAGGAIWAGLSNAGQSCAAVERVYVERGIYDAFRERVVRQVQALRIGADTAFEVDIGSLTQNQQKEKVEELVRDAVVKGAKIACRRDVPDGMGTHFFPLMVLEDVNGSMLVMKEEVFGPVLALERVRDEDEAVQKANASEYGLSASVWSRSARRARRVAERLEAGTVTINDHLMTHGMAETPWGGFKSSGIGRSHGEIGFLEMSQPRVLIADRLHRLPRNMWWYPHGRKVYNGLKSALTVLYGKGLFVRIGAALRVGRLFMRSFTKRG